MDPDISHNFEQFGVLLVILNYMLCGRTFPEAKFQASTFCANEAISLKLLKKRVSEFYKV